LGVAFAVPVWLVALALAAAAPVILGAIHAALLSRVRKRTLALVARAQATKEADEVSTDPEALQA
jgi:hypothetical protein